MCVYKRWIYNKYTQKRILVKCGHCPACLVEKAHHRAGRIKNNVYDGEVSIFCTLTYANECMPYVYLKDLLNCEHELKVYRDTDVRRVRVNGDYKMRYKVTPNHHVLDTFYMPDDFYKGDFEFHGAYKRPDVVSVCYYKDIQNFFKRLDINLKRRYGFEGKLQRFACQEYGTKHHRSHFHVVFFCKPMDVQTVMLAVNEAWPFDRGRARHRKCEQTRGSVANYVASYVNSFSSFHPLLSSRDFRSRCSYSRGFGLAPSDFSIDSLLAKAQKGDLRWTFRSLVQRIPQDITVSIPKYVINRFFPKFKGYSRLASSQVLDVLSCPERLRNYANILCYGQSDVDREVTKLTNARKRYKYPLMFAHDYLLVWSVHTRMVLRSFYETLENTQFDYDNISDLLEFPSRSPSLLHLLQTTDKKLLDPNNYPRNVAENMLLLEEFRTHQKHREINQLYFESQDFEQLI